MIFGTAMLPVILAFSLLTGCAPKRGVEVGCVQFHESHHLTQDIKVVAGDEFVMRLCSNPTTGFRWSEQANISNREVVEQVGHEFVSPSDEDQPLLAGASGEEVWTFKALGEGVSTISVEYSRPWEGGEKATWTFVLSVTVQ